MIHDYDWRALSMMQDLSHPKFNLMGSTILINWKIKPIWIISYYLTGASFGCKLQYPLKDKISRNGGIEAKHNLTYVIPWQTTLILSLIGEKIGKHFQSFVNKIRNISPKHYQYTWSLATATVEQKRNSANQIERSRQIPTSCCRWWSSYGKPKDSTVKTARALSSVSKCR